MKTNVVLIAKPRRPNTSSLVQKLRRIRTELALMVQQVDDALNRIDEEKKS